MHFVSVWRIKDNWLVWRLGESVTTGGKAKHNHRSECDNPKNLERVLHLDSPFNAYL